MSELDLLTWARGPGLQISLGIGIVGTLLRLLEILGLGRKHDLAPARPGHSFLDGARTVFSRSLPKLAYARGSAITYVSGYVFHLGFFITLLMFAPHILLLKSMLGLSWPALPSALVDAVALLAMGALAVALGHRLCHPVKRFLSTFDDYLAWGLTFLPLATGYLALHHLLLPYTTMLALHLLSAELLLALLPFAKLAHTFTFALSRWYTGDWFGRRGVKA